MFYNHFSLYDYIFIPNWSLYIETIVIKGSLKCSFTIIILYRQNFAILLYLYVVGSSEIVALRDPCKRKNITNKQTNKKAEKGDDVSRSP